VHIHLHETRGEVLQAVEANGERPSTHCVASACSGPRTQCVHMTDLGRQDIESLAETGAQVVHCPQSNMKLASGSCPVSALLAAGVNVALGTDGAASNNDLNLFNEMHSAALLAKLREATPRRCPRQRLEMATLGGARALGLEERSAAWSRQAGGPDRRRPVGPGDATALQSAFAARVRRPAAPRSRTAGWPGRRCFMNAAA
jgi:5-methylthioadenosine/S-adenosylhomocysteine deaminase